MLRLQMLGGMCCACCAATLLWLHRPGQCVPRSSLRVRAAANSALCRAGFIPCRAVTNTPALPPPSQFKDEPAALKLKHDAAGVVGFANSGGRPGRAISCFRCTVCAADAIAVLCSSSFRAATSCASKPSAACLPPLALCRCCSRWPSSGHPAAGKHSNTSQFYITLAKAPACDGKHVVIGRVVEGLEVLQQIGGLSGRLPCGPGADLPGTKPATQGGGRCYIALGCWAAANQHELVGGC